MLTIPADKPHCDFSGTHISLENNQSPKKSSKSPETSHCGISLFSLEQDDNVTVTRTSLPPGKNSPVLDQGDIKSSPSPPRPQIERPRGPEQGDAVCCVICVERGILQERFHKLWQLKLFIIIRQRFLTLKCRNPQYICFLVASAQFSELAKYFFALMDEVGRC